MLRCGLFAVQDLVYIGCTNLQKGVYFSGDLEYTIGAEISAMCDNLNRRVVITPS